MKTSIPIFFQKTLIKNLNLEVDKSHLNVPVSSHRVFSGHVFDYDSPYFKDSDGKIHILESNLKVDGKWLPRVNPQFSPQDSQRHIVKAAEYMYSLAPFYKIIKFISLFLDNVVFLNLDKFVPVPTVFKDQIKSYILYSIVRVKPHHTKSIVQYSDGSCDTFEMYAVDNMLELSPNEYSTFDKEYMASLGLNIDTLYTYDHLNLFYVDHYEAAQAGLDCSQVKVDHGLLDFDYFHELVYDNEQLIKYDHDNAWWLNENDILGEYVFKFPFKLDLKTGNKVLTNRLNGAKRLDRINRVMFESSYNRDQLSYGSQLSADRKWVLPAPGAKPLSRLDLMHKLHAMTNKMIRYDNFWANCQDWSSFPLQQLDSNYKTYSEFTRQILGGYLHLDFYYNEITKYLFVLMSTQLSAVKIAYIFKKLVYKYNLDMYINLYGFDELMKDKINQHVKDLKTYTKTHPQWRNTKTKVSSEESYANLNDRLPSDSDRHPHSLINVDLETVMQRIDYSALKAAALEKFSGYMREHYSEYILIDDAIELASKYVSGKLNIWDSMKIAQDLQTQFKNFSTTKKAENVSENMSDSNIINSRT